jgi:hypothetical protein
MVGLVRFEISRPETVRLNRQRDAKVGRRATLKNAHRILGIVSLGQIFQTPTEKSAAPAHLVHGE